MGLEGYGIEVGREASFVLLQARDAIEAMESRENASESLADTEAEQIRKVLAAVGGNKSHAAKLLGIERKTLYRKLERMGIT